MMNRNSDQVDFDISLAKKAAALISSVGADEGQPEKNQASRV